MSSPLLQYRAELPYQRIAIGTCINLYHDNELNAIDPKIYLFFLDEGRL